ncbi:DEAD/DEAH box helicase family protein [Arcanobacterium canis]|uniref:DEAD/DEAH box helicase family protein n=1 Tax=Arcanobacterium canis TaxID=999183 RepID=A0ABY8FXN0_9ACTO|nr:DEAD/DEAH box helicase family protein [Arcanobacterium canis]WFM82997.1 DEAD/DEAH box helicase family protein [Arcanobacterium canis]
MTFEIFEFQGVWRSYQARVLEHISRYSQDNKVHIVAAPGSGKTTLGIEMIVKKDLPCLILVPTLVMRNQWKARILQAFVRPENRREAQSLISTDLKNPSTITIATYQALFQAMNALPSDAQAHNGDDGADWNDVSAREYDDVDYSHFDLIRAMREKGLGLICLDECHHLRNAWWKSLEDFLAAHSGLFSIALTATPPYDSTPNEWKRYISVCGEIDEEITIPELVKEGVLCPHQDFIYLNYPTSDELTAVKDFEERSTQALQHFQSLESFAQIVASQGLFQGTLTLEDMLENPKFLSSLLIYKASQGQDVPKHYLRTLGVKHLPKLDKTWLEVLLQNLLYDSSETFEINNSQRDEIISFLKAMGLVEKRKVSLVKNSKIERKLIQSAGKFASINNIVGAEYSCLGNDLRMTILTDYIRKEYIKHIGGDAPFPLKLGALPLFEFLRRSIEKQYGNAGPKLGVLSGSVVILPTSALRYLGAESQNLNISTVGTVNDEEYVQVSPSGSCNNLIQAVTELHSHGNINILIGTTALLGEGWDAPHVNSLILASYVGSFILSNQMRGRAIRVDPQRPDKTANIWHLACIKPHDLARKPLSEGIEETTSDDLDLVARRFDHFLGLDYEKDLILSGIERITFLNEYHVTHGQNAVTQINSKMTRLASRRPALRDKWQRSLALFDEIEIANEVSVQKSTMKIASFYDYITFFGISIFAFLVNFAHRSGLIFTPRTRMATVIFLLVAATFVGVRTFLLSSPIHRLKKMGQGVVGALRRAELLKGEVYLVNVAPNDTNTYAQISLKGANSHEKEIFARSIIHMLSPIDNQKYLIVRKRYFGLIYDFYAVPATFEKNRELAEIFVQEMNKNIGHHNLVYTRNVDGRKVLLKARVKSFANKQNRFITGKKVQSALE